MQNLFPEKKQTKKIASMTWLGFASSTLNTAGTLMISFVLLSVHEKLKEEREIDQSVIDELNKEQIVVVVALILIALAWALLVISEFREVYDRRKLEAVKSLVVNQTTSGKKPRFRPTKK